MLDIIRQAPAWFNGKRMKVGAEGEQLLLEARMLAIVDAYDSMTSAHVYRPARWHGVSDAGTFRMFGHAIRPAAGGEFAEFYRSDRVDWSSYAEKHWLTQLDPTAINLYWQLNRNFADATLYCRTCCLTSDCWKTCTTRYLRQFQPADHALESRGGADDRHCRKRDVLAPVRLRAVAVKKQERRASQGGGMPGGRDIAGRVRSLCDGC